MTKKKKDEGGAVIIDFMQARRARDRKKLRELKQRCKANKPALRLIRRHEESLKEETKEHPRRPPKRTV